MRRFEVHNGLEGAGDIHTAGQLIRIPKAATVATRVNKVTVGRFLVQAAAGNSNVGDGMSAADTTGTPGRLILGLVVAVCNIMGARLDRQILEPTDEGAALIIPARRAIFKGIEDADGGIITDAGGFASIILGTPTGEAQRHQTNYFTPLPNDKIDSSSITAGTEANRALRLLAPVGDITNVGPEARIWKFTVTPAFSAQI